uniref:Putative flagellar assembly protein FliH n=1 Tax=mine drainage metagenome TaxID=410659 RepID=E6QR76_9ZZZZ
MIPKEQLTAYQRWEMASFEDHPEQPSSVAGLAASEELKVIHEQARREGYTAGLTEGYQVGYDEGTQSGLNESRVAAQQLIAQLSLIITQYNEELAQADRQIAADLLTLATGIAHAMLKTTLPIHPELLLPVITAAIHDLPALQRNTKLSLNPGDVALVREHLHDELAQHGWSIVEDPQIEAGGCRIESNSNQLDATLNTRWQRLATALGQNLDWLTP